MAKVAELLRPNVLGLCHDRRISQAELAEKIGMQPQQLSRQLRGETDFRASFIDRLSEALGVEPAGLLGDPTRPKVAPSSKDMIDLEARIRKLERQLISAPRPQEKPFAPHLASLVEQLQGEQDNELVIDAVRDILALASRRRGGRSDGTNGP